MPVWQCKEAFAFWRGGHPIVVSHGDLVSNPKDPRYKGHEGAWELVEDKAARQASPHTSVEAATANPGERRSFRPKE